MCVLKTFDSKFCHRPGIARSGGRGQGQRNKLCLAGLCPCQSFQSKDSDYFFFLIVWCHYRAFLKILTHFFRILLWHLLQHKRYWGPALIRDNGKFISIVFHHYLSFSLQTRAEDWNVSHFWPNRFRLCAALLRELCDTPELSPPSHTPWPQLLALGYLWVHASRSFPSHDPIGRKLVG